MINRESFYKHIRTNLFSGSMSLAQVQGIEGILNKWEKSPAIYIDKRWLAYILATVYHETAKTMQAIEEYGKGKTRPYGKKLKMSGIVYTVPNKLYYGRGKVQLTWYENYEHMSRILYHDSRLLLEPELLLDDKVSNDVLFEGMTKGNSSFGDFTGKSLENYFSDNPPIDDPYNARRIINGKDKANLIAKYYYTFLEALA